MKVLPVLSGLLCAVALAGCGHHAPTAPPPAAPPVAVTPPAPPAAAPPAPPRTKAVVYTVDNAHGKDTNNYLVPHTVPLAAHPQDPARAALLALLAVPGTPIPAGTRLNGIKTEDGLATVDFSRSPVDETHGEEKQTQALEALQRTLGQFPEISRIQITVGGQVPESIGESGGGPMDVIRPGEKPQETGGA